MCPNSLEHSMGIKSRSYDMDKFVRRHHEVPNDECQKCGNFDIFKINVFYILHLSQHLCSCKLTITKSFFITFSMFSLEKKAVVYDSNKTTFQNDWTSIMCYDTCYQMSVKKPEVWQYSLITLLIKQRNLPCRTSFGRTARTNMFTDDGTVAGHL